MISRNQPLRHQVCARKNSDYWAECWLFFSESQRKDIKMIKGSEVRIADYPIDTLFLDRWSPRAMTGETIPQQELMVLFEAARWAPSSYNNQPWRILYARRDSEHWPLFFDLLVEFNQGWAKNAAALLLFISKTTFDMNGEPSVTHSFDTGAAWENLALQGWLKGLVVHGMQGFDFDRARTALNIPEAYSVDAMAAVGRPGDPSVLPAELRDREWPSDRRKLEQTICEGPFCF
jgi:nitroreductase